VYKRPVGELEVVTKVVVTRGRGMVGKKKKIINRREIEYKGVKGKTVKT